MLKSLECSTIVVVFLISLSSISFAGEQNSFFVSYKARYIKQSDVKNRSGDFSLGRTCVSFKNSYELFDTIPVDVGIGLKQFIVNDDSDVDLPNTLQSRDIRLGIRFPASFLKMERLFMGLDLLPSWSSAGDHDFASEAFRFNFAGSLIFRESEKFIVACGVWVRPEYRNKLVPFCGLIYRPNDKLLFNFLSSEPSVSYKMTDKTKIMLELSFLASEFEVTQGTRNGEIVRISDLEAGVGLEHAFNEFFKGALSIGFAFDQKYEYYSAEEKVSPEDSLYAGYRFDLRF